MAGGHGPYKLSDTAAVFDLHGRFEFGMEFRVIWANGGVKLFKPCTIRWECGWVIARNMSFAEPTSKIFVTKFGDVCMT